MQLTKQTDFAFRTLIYLAWLPDDEITQIQPLCDYYDISPNHVSKVVVKLAKLGYIKATRGKGGGIRLAMKPADINIAEVVRDFEPVLSAVNCDEPPCRIAAGCMLKGALDSAMQAFIDTLAAYSLEDFVGAHRRSDGISVLTVLDPKNPA